MEVLNILIFAYNRPEHLKKCLQSLSKNNLYSECEVTICVDGCKNNALPHEIELQQQTVNVAKNENWEFEISLIINEHNLGLSKQYFSKIDLLFEKHDNLIVVEDDIILGVYFLDYMKQAFIKYCDETGISMILGYVYSIPFLGKNHTSFFAKSSGNKAFGITKKSWKKLDRTCKGWEKLKTSSKLRKRFNLPGINCSQLLIDEMEGKKNVSWDSILYWNCFANNLLGLCPDQTLAIDNGWDYSGTNTFGDNMFDTVEFDKEYRIYIFPNKVKEDYLKKILVYIYFAFYLRGLFLIKTIKNIFRKN